MKKGLLAAVIVLLGSVAHADDWPQFRGPDRDGISKEKGLLKVWPKGGPALAWTFKDAGLGHSSFAIVKGVLYTLGTDKAFTDEYVIAIDAAKGTELWRAKIGPLYVMLAKRADGTTYNANSYGDGPRSTPTIDGGFLYALGGMGDLACIDLASKKEVWRKNLIGDLGGDIMDKYGFSEAPLIDGDLLICTPGGAKGTLAALDKKTGKEIWRSKEWTERATFSSAIAANIQGVRQYLQLGYTGGTKGGSLAGVDAKGKVLWKKHVSSGDSESGISTSPIVKGNEVYITVASPGGCHLFDIDPKQEATEKYTALKTRKRFKNTHGGVVLVDGAVYGHTEPGAWIAQDFKTGNENWLERDTLKCQSGAVISADGLLFLYTDEGDIALVSADPKAFNLISSFKNPQKSMLFETRTSSRASRIWSHPAIANGHLYLRDQEYIFAYKIAK